MPVVKTIASEKAPRERQQPPWATRNQPEKSASGDFSRHSKGHAYPLSPEAQQSCRELLPTPTKTVSDVYVGQNLYAFVGNDGVNRWDYLGLEEQSPKAENPIYKTVEDAIAAGSVYALLGSERNLRSRQARFEKLPAADKVGKTKPLHLYEYCGKVCCTITNEKEKRFYFAKAVTQKSYNACFRTNSKCKKGDKDVGTYHNHPDPGGLSRTDMKNAREKDLPVGVASRSAQGEVEVFVFDPNKDIKQRKYDNTQTTDGVL